MCFQFRVLPLDSIEHIPNPKQYRLLFRALGDGKLARGDIFLSVQCFVKKDPKDPYL